MKLPYEEGSVFLVPVEGGGFARGVVARSATRGGCLFGCFFGPRLENQSDATLDGLAPDRAILKARFGDLGLINGEWLVIGAVSDWDRAQWSMPDFVRRESLRERAWRVRYEDTDPAKIEAEWPTEYDSDLEQDAMSGYVAVEIKLDMLLPKQLRSTFVPDGTDCTGRA